MQRQLHLRHIKQHSKKENENTTSTDTTNKPPNPSPSSILKPSDLIKKNVTNNIEPPKKEEQKKEEEIDPLNFFNVEHHEIKPITGDDTKSLIDISTQKHRIEYDWSNNTVYVGRNIADEGRDEL